MTETIKADSLVFEGKAFVFDKTIAEFVIGDKRYFHDEYDRLHGHPYNAYYGEDDPENTVVKAVLEAGGVVRQKISGKTDYYVVGVYDNKNKDYQKQKEKGKPVVAISLEDLKRILGVGANEDEVKETGSEFVDVYEPLGQSAVSYAAENIEVEDYAVSGEDASDWEYTIEGDHEKLFIRDYIGDNDKITIPTSIDGKKVFLPPQFPNTLSFPKCRAKTIRIPGSFKEIPVGLFEYNKCVEEIVVGSGIEVIETNFCFDASNLSKVHFPDTIREVGGWILKGTAWYEAQGTEIIAGNVLLRKFAEEFPTNEDAVYAVPEGVSVIAGFAFFEENSDRNPNYITRIELPESVRYISESAFLMSNLSSIKVPSTVVHIGKKAFNGTYLRSYYEKEQYFIIGDLLYELIPKDPVAVIPDGVKRIADEAVSAYSSWMLEELILPDSLEEIGEASFAGCSNLKSVKLNDNLKKIGDYAFSGCSSLATVLIPDSVETIGANAFMGCDGIDIQKSVKNHTKVETEKQKKGKADNDKEKRSLGRKISYRKREIEALSLEIEQLRSIGDSKEEKAKYIESILAEKYDAFHLKYPLDKSQEPAIKSFADDANDKFRALRNAFKRKHDEELRDMRSKMYSSYYDPELLEDIDRIRRMVKKYINDLTQLFNRVESKTQHFFEKGMTEANLHRLVKIMDEIYKEGEEIKITFNASMDELGIVQEHMPYECERTRDYWRNMEQNIPEDIEERDRKKEATANKTVQEKLEKAKAAFREADQRLLEIGHELKSNRTELDNLKKELEESRSNLETEREKIERKADAEINKIRNQLSVTQKNKEKKIREKRELEAALANTFAVAFSKKKKYKEEIDSAVSSIVHLESKEEHLQGDLRRAEVQKNKDISNLSRNIDRLEKNIGVLEKEIRSAPNEIIAAKKNREAKVLELNRAQEEADYFHVDYLIKTHDEIINGLSEKILAKERKVEKLKGEISQFEKKLLSMVK